MVITGTREDVTSRTALGDQAGEAELGEVLRHGRAGRPQAARRGWRRPAHRRRAATTSADGWGRPASAGPRRPRRRARRAGARPSSHLVARCRVRTRLRIVPEGGAVLASVRTPARRRPPAPVEDIDMSSPLDRPVPRTATRPFSGGGSARPGGERALDLPSRLAVRACGTERSHDSQEGPVSPDSPPPGRLRPPRRHPRPPRRPGRRALARAGPAHRRAVHRARGARRRAAGAAGGGRGARRPAAHRAPPRPARPLRHRRVRPRARLGPPRARRGRPARRARGVPVPPELPRPHPHRVPRRRRSRPARAAACAVRRLGAAAALGAAARPPRRAGRRRRHRPGGGGARRPARRGAR